jgi:hypothetical protein
MACKVFQMKALESWAEVCFLQGERSLLEVFLRAASVSLVTGQVGVLRLNPIRILVRKAHLWLKRGP